MAGSRRQLWLGAALVALLLVAAFVWTTGGTDSTASSRRQAAAAAGRNRGAAVDDVADVRLEALRADRAEPAGRGRNPFHYDVRAAPAGGEPDVVVENGSSAPPVAAVPPGPPPVPPINLKFIGFVTRSDGARVAVLTDGRRPESGREGDIILGRYRILKIGEESIELAYLDGRGRQTIRLTGR